MRSQAYSTQPHSGRSPIHTIGDDSLQASRNLKSGLQVHSPNPETKLLTLYFCNEWGKLGDRKHTWQTILLVTKGDSHCMTRLVRCRVHCTYPHKTQNPRSSSSAPTKWYYTYIKSIKSPLYFHVILFSMYICFPLPSSNVEVLITF